MINGLEVFRDHFKGFEDRYVLIGGAACDLVFEQAGLPFRATKDLDLVLYIETLDADFTKAFWAFVKDGAYEVQGKATKKKFYRFFKPATQDYPFMLELFSRTPDILEIAEGSQLTPLPVDDEISSLSAILMDETYYQFLKTGTIQIEGVPIAQPEVLIPLKARAWLDLKARKEKGEKVDSRNVKKHKHDIFRLFQVIDPTNEKALTGQLKLDFQEFLEQIKKEQIPFKDLGLGSMNLEQVVAEIQRIYRID